MYVELQRRENVQEYTELPPLHNGNIKRNIMNNWNENNEQIKIKHFTIIYVLIFQKHPPFNAAAVS